MSMRRAPKKTLSKENKFGGYEGSTKVVSLLLDLRVVVATVRRALENDTSIGEFLLGFDWTRRFATAGR
jgi:hypothetical protein